MEGKTTRSPRELEPIIRALVRLARADGELRALAPASAALDDRAAVERRRRTALAEIPDEIAAAYDSLALAGRWPPIVALKDGYCSGCHLRLPPQLANHIARRLELDRCPHCQRIVYDLEALAGAASTDQAAPAGRGE